MARTTVICGVVLAAILTGCAGAKPKQAGDEDNFNESVASSPASPAPETKPTKWDASSETGTGSSPESGGLNEDQKKQMEIALRRGGEKAGNCGDVVPDAPKGEGEVTVIFDGQKGRAVDVQVGSPWAGTNAESCIKRAFIGEIIIPFDGEPKHVPHKITIAAAKKGK